MKMKFTFYSKAKCKVTGTEGIITAISEYSNGCIQYLLTQKVQKDGTVPKAFWVDEQDVKVLKRKEPVEVKKSVGGGFRSHSAIGMKE